MINAGIDPTSVGIVPADGHVIDADQDEKQRHRQDEPERAIAGDRKGQANDVSLAGTPITIQNSRCPRRIDVTRSFGLAENHPEAFLLLESVLFRPCCSTKSQK